jgi:hypothetical protein
VLALPGRTPILGAAVELVGTTYTAETDSAGEFALRDLPAGPYVLQIRAVGYAPRAWRIRVSDGRTLRGEFELEPSDVKLPAITSTGKQPEFGRRYAEFERRRLRRIGYFLTKNDIDKLNASTLMDVLATVRGVSLDCSGGVCVARMARSVDCQPQYFIDGEESTSYFASNTPPHDILGLEIYRGASETPGEFIGSNSACGVIVIWTKSSP